MKIELSEIDEMKRALEILTEEFQKLSAKVNPLKCWYTLKDACEFKGVNYNTINNKPRLKPNNGIPDGIVTGKRMWNVKTINKWVLQNDKDLEDEFNKRNTRNN